jgi:hypothetical protein
MLNRALFSLYFETELKRNALGDSEMRTEFMARKQRLRTKTFAINLGLVNLYCLLNRVSRRLLVLGNLLGGLFAYVNYRNHLFDDAIELMAKSQITSESN